MRRALILCTGNSCRSQMAEALWRDRAHGQWEAHSAGTEPAGYVHPLALRVLQESGLELTARSKNVDEFAGQEFDIVVTVCDDAHDKCAAFPGAARQMHWPFFDPARATGSEQQQLAVFRRVRDEIAARIEAFFASDPEAADQPL